MTVTLLTLALSLPAAPAPAPKIEPPKGPAPRVVMIASETEGKLTLLDTTQEIVPVTRTVAVTDPQGRVVQVQQTIMVAQCRTVKRTLDADKVRVYGLDGKKIEDKDVRKLLTKPMPALVSTDGKPVDRFYLQLARPGTLVLVLPPMSAPPLPDGLPVPAPKRLPVEKK